MSLSLRGLEAMLTIKSYRSFDCFKPTRLLARLFTWIALTLSATALIGYVQGATSLVHLVPSPQAMSPLTAAALATLSISTLARRRHKLAELCAGFAGSTGLSVVCSHVLTGHDRLSDLFGSLLSVPDDYLGHTSLATAACLSLLALARLAQLRDQQKGADVLAILTFFIAVAGLLGYGYGVRDLYALYLFNTMALQTAIALACLAAATLLYRLDRGWLRIIAMNNRAGHMTRRQLLLTTMLPLFGLILTRAVDARTLGASVGIALLVTGIFLPLLVVIIRQGRVVERLDKLQAHQKEIEDRIRVNLEAELDEKRVLLEQETAQRRLAEEAMNRAQRLEAVGQLTGGIAHDFNNLLMGISGNLEMLQRKLENDPQTLKYVTRAAQSTQKGTRLTAQLLAFSRTQRLNILAVNLGETIDSALELISNALGPDIRIELIAAPGTVWVSTDPLQLEMAILNLAINAKDAMPHGGVFSVKYASSNATGMVSLTVSDIGTGMPPDILSKICEPFFTTKGQGRGTGLGLAQVYGLCKQCQGDLKITSEMGRGSTFELIFPQALPTQTGLDRVAHETSPIVSCPPERPVLIVDDDDNVRAILVDDLRSKGFTVLEANRGSTGLELLSKTHCAVAIIDFLMPGINGAEVALKAREIDPKLPIISSVDTRKQPR